METRLIMLPQPILVSDEEIKGGDFMYLKEYHHQGQIRKCHYITDEQLMIDAYEDIGWGFCKRNEVYEIIAGLPELPKTGLSLIAEEIGWVDVEKLAEEKYPIQKGGSAWMPTTHDCIQANKQEGFIEGFKAAQSLNEKYSENEMIDFHNFVFRHPNQYLTMGEYLNEFKRSIKPKEYLVEVQTERTRYPKGDDGWEDVYTPKITNNTIKVTKILH